MHYQTLGTTDLNVSAIALGTMTYGEQNTEQEAHAQLDMALDHGINLIDCAELYPVPPFKETQGSTEAYIGRWLKQSGRREDVVLATKVVGPGDWVRHIRPEPRLDARNIDQAIYSSLERLQTDYIDLYQLHWPERSTNYFGKLGFNVEDTTDEQAISLQATLEALKKHVDAGRIRHIGLSNETPWGVMQCLRLARQHDLPRVMSIQNPYNLLNRTFEIGLAEVSYREQCGLLAYSPLGFGVLTGKYLNQQKPEGARLTKWSRFSRYNHATAVKTTERYVKLAHDHALDPAQMALAYVNSRPFVTSNIIGATSVQQLKNNIESINLQLSDEVLKGIEDIHESQPNPCP